jgi:hypothetical protein
MNLLACDRSPNNMKLTRLYISSEYEPRLIESTLLPEHYLLAAILERAIADLYSSDFYVIRNAISWFDGIKPSNGGFSYTQIINTLSFTPSQLALITNEIKVMKELFDDKYVCEGQTRGEKRSRVAERKGMLISQEKRTELRKAYARRHRFAG